MFTGIIEEMGTVVSLKETANLKLWDGTTGKGTELTIKGSVVLQDAYLGCSIAVNGVCLTASKLPNVLDKSFNPEDPENLLFTVGLAPETLRLTNLEQLSYGEKVNLERASLIGGRNSGHSVQGHIDGKGKVIDKWQDGDSLFLKFQTPKTILKYIVKKGFIAIDGTSLTVCDVHRSLKDDGWFTVMLVGYTQNHIILPEKKVGSEVNLEVDVIGKYAESAVQGMDERVTLLEEEVRKLKLSCPGHVVGGKL